MTKSLLYILTVVIWGTTWLAIKLQVGEISPEISIFYRFFLASITLFLYCYFKKLNLRFTVREHFFLFLQGFCMFSVHFIFIYIASSYLVSGLISVIFSLVSVFNLFNGALFLKKYPTKQTLLGVGLGFLGIVMFFWKELFAFSWKSQTMLGVYLTLAGTLLFSFGNIISKFNQNQKARFISSTTISMGYGTLILFLYCMLNKASFVLPQSITYWISLIYLATAGSTIAFLCYLRLISIVGPDKAGYATILFPLVALLISVFFEDYSLKNTDFLAISFILLGNTLVMSKKEFSLIIKRKEKGFIARMVGFVAHRS